MAKKAGERNAVLGGTVSRAKKECGNVPVNRAQEAQKRREEESGPLSESGSLGEATVSSKGFVSWLDEDD